MTPLKVLLVSTWNTSCGIAEHAAYLKESVEAADATIQIVPAPVLLNPDDLISIADVPTYDSPIVHLNYQAALHSRWNADRIRRWQEGGHKVVVTYHDSGVPNSDQCKAICAAADYFVIHEPYDDLPGHGEYLRMGVPEYRGTLYPPHPEANRRPIVGTCGHDFPWKCWPELAGWAQVAGWGLRICTPEITDERRHEIRSINPWTEFCVGLDRETLVDALHGCDATAFVNVCHNTGQSGAILQGIGARKPVIALSTCRQYRSLYLDEMGREAIRWVETFAAVSYQLTTLPLSRVDTRLLPLAEHESWRHVGARYAAIYRSLL